MNWLDILLIIINVVLFIIAIIGTVEMIKDDDIASLMPWWFCYLVVILFTIILPFVVIDKHSGATIGTITSVDKNFFGTTAIYIKTTENKEEEYCIEFDEGLETQANKYIGKKVKISYGKRVGFYSTGKCSQAPIEKIELLESN